jgi:TPR repeat protein
MFNVALAYQNGRGTSKNEDLAEIWFRKAADAGHEKAKAKVQAIEEEKKKKAAAAVPADFVITDSSGNSVDIMEYMAKLSMEAKKRRYVCSKCKTGFYTADTEHAEPCPNCGAMVEKK